MQLKHFTSLIFPTCGQFVVRCFSAHLTHAGFLLRYFFAYTYCQHRMHCGTSLLWFGDSTVTIVFRTFLISNISLLLLLGSSSLRNSGNGCLVSYLVMLFIALTWCPIFASSSHMLFLFVFGCNPVITAL